MSFLSSRQLWRQGLVVLLTASLPLLAGCRSDRVIVNPDDPDSPQYAYRLDQLALLQMAADDIMELERKKQYGRIYDDYGSDEFKKSVSRRRFLIMANCVENWLGGLLEFDGNDLGFRRETLKDQPNRPLDVLTREVSRIRDNIDEQLVFVEDGLKFKLNSIYWISKDKQFLQCIADSPLIEAGSQPTPVLDESQSATPEASATTEPTATPGEALPAGQPAAGTETPASETPAPEAPAPKAPAKVEVLKPAEVNKDTIHARPAGAGALKDPRPAASPKPEAKKPVEKPAATAEPAPPVTELNTGSEQDH